MVDLSNSTILVSGGAGYIGSHVALSLLAEGCRVVVIDNLSTGHRELIPDGVTFIEADLADTRTVTDVMTTHGVDTVMHFAGSSIVPESVLEPLRYYENNVCVSHALFGCCVAAGVKSVVFSSTAAVYGVTEQAFVTEDMTPDPQTPYGRSKLMVEWMLRDIAQVSGMNFLALRYFNVAGADPQMRTGQISDDATHLIKVSCETALGVRDQVTIFGNDYDTADGTCVRDYIHVSDLAQVHVEGAKYLKAGGASTVLNCGYGHGASVREVVQAIDRHLTGGLNVVEGARREGDVPHVVAGVEKIRAVLNWTPRYDDLDTIVSTSLTWEAKQRGIDLAGRIRT